MNYKILLTPAEPYFFGNEKSFKYPGQETGGAYSNNYFIRGEDLPSQSAILGVLRFLLLPNIKTDYSYSDKEKEENGKAVGKESFNIDSFDVQDFGVIKNISPVFITDGADTYIPVPLNDNSAVGKRIIGEATEARKIKDYVPLSDFRIISNTSDGKRLYTEEYDVKSGLSSGFLNLTDRCIYSDFIHSTIRVGINRHTEKNGFFKKEYKTLRKGCSFAVYAQIDKDVDDTPISVFMGQGKSPFSVRFIKAENTLVRDVESVLSGAPDDYSLIYCLGNAVVNSNPCENTLFSAYRSSDYRSFMTNFNQSVKKGTLHRLIKAGSIFITDKPDEWMKDHSNKNAEKIGFNQFIILTGGRKE